MEKRFKAKDETFWQRMTLPVEECLKRGIEKPAGGYRWFRSPNIIPIEHYRAPEKKPAPRQKAS